jgi:L-aminopeptidase/D-esterase-like protein
VAKWRGFEQRRPGGIGSAVRRVGEVTVGALVVLNSVGDIFSLDGRSLTGGEHEPGPPSFAPDAFSNTTLVVVATDAALSRAEASRLGVRAHDALGACVRPAHTRYDGDVVFSVSCGTLSADVDVVAEAAFAATAVAIEAGVQAASA